MYGYIGQKADPYFGEDPAEDITDLAVVRVIKELEQKYNRINIRINSPGGSVMHGDPIITAIRNSKAEIHTYADGITASMAADIWMVGHVRHAAINSKIMIHTTGTFAMGTAKDMRAAAEMLDKFDEVAIATFADATGMPEDDVKTRFYDYADHWLSAKDAQKLGLIADIENYKTASPIEAPERLNWRQLLDQVSKVRVSIPEPEPDTVPADEFEKELLRLNTHLNMRDSITKNDY